MRYLKEPLLHFILLGVCIFVAYSALREPPPGAGREIRVDAPQIALIRDQYRRTWKREPGEDELRNLVQAWVVDEAYYRRALELGLDRNDVVVRRRLRQKLEFFTALPADALVPEEGELQRYLDAHADDYRARPRYSFEQVFISSDRSQDQLADTLAQAATELRAGRAFAADRSTFLPDTITARTDLDIDRIFGSGFSLALAGLPLDSWAGPVQSGLGFHFVRLSAVKPGATPDLAQVRDEVLRDWRYQRELEARAAVEAELLESYDVTVEWPEEAEG